MELPTKIKECLTDFLSKNGAIDIMNSAEFADGATWLNSQLKIQVTQTGKDKLMVEMSNNSRSGFTEFKMEYSL